MVIVSTNRFAIVNNSGREQPYSHLFTQHHHLGIFGSTRSGKSTLLKEVITLALDEGLPVTGFEAWYSLSQMSPLAELAQAKGGSLLNINNLALNLLQLPDLRHLSEIEQEFRLEEYIDLLVFALKTIVLAPPNEAFLFAAIIELALKAFFANPKICRRYQAAIAEGSSSKAWVTMPTLVDFLPYCTPEYLSLSGQDAQVCQLIQNSLSNTLRHPIGKAISTNSNALPEMQFMVFGLQNKQIQSPPILTISALLPVMRRLLSAPKSLLFSDDCYSLLSNPQTAMFITRVCTMGKKFGIKFALSSQDINGIRSQILENLDLKFFGKNPATAIRTFEQAFSYPHQIISQCATKDFEPTESYTNWLLDGIDRNDLEFQPNGKSNHEEPYRVTTNLERLTFCRHYLR